MRSFQLRMVIGDWLLVIGKILAAGRSLVIGHWSLGSVGKTFLLLPLLFLATFSFSGCEKRDWREPVKVHWDRDMCERCKMALSERKYATEVIDPRTHKHYKFDDIGCAILWFRENHIPWEKEAVIWVKDGKTGRWIDARKAWYSTDKLSPMGYGFTAFAKKEDAGKGEVIDFAEVKRRVIKIGR